MAYQEELLPGYQIGLSAINQAVLAGFGDTLLSGNATVTAMISAVDGTALAASFDEPAKERIKKGLRIGQLSGAVSETHSLTTVAGWRSAFTALVPALPSTFTGHGYQ